MAKAKAVRPKRKKPVVVRVRRNPYERTLDLAQARLAKAIEERGRCNMRMMELNREIPKLNEVVRALGGFFDTPPSAPKPELIAPPNPPKVEGHILAGVPDHLKRFVVPRAEPGESSAETTTDEDAFLVDDFGGKDLTS